MQNHLRKSKQQCLFTHSHLRDKRKSNWKGRTNNNYNNKQHQSLFVDQHRQDETQHLESRAAPSLRAKNQHHMEIITLKNWRKSKEEEQNAHKQTKKVFTRKKKYPSFLHWTRRAGRNEQSSSQKNKRMLALHILWRIVTRNIF